jgi:uncharacterized protein YjlB
MKARAFESHVETQDHLTSQVEVFLLPDDGLVPNNDKLPLLLYRAAVDVVAGCGEPEEAFMALFGAHDWGGAWIDGVFDYHHYHSTAHEVLGFARGSNSAARRVWC